MTRSKSSGQREIYSTKCMHALKKKKDLKSTTGFHFMKLKKEEQFKMNASRRNNFKKAINQ